MQYLKEEVRAKILASALNEFHEHGFSRAQMRRISKGAGVATGNIYRYFKNKDEIFAAIVKPVYDDISKMIFSTTREQDIKAATHDIATRIMDVYRKYGRELVVITTKSQGSKYENFTETLIKLVCKRIKKELFAEDDIKNDTLTYVISSGFVRGIFTIMQTCTDPDQIEELINRMLVFYFDNLEERIIYPIANSSKIPTSTK